MTTTPAEIGDLGLDVQVKPTVFLGTTSLDPDIDSCSLNMENIVGSSLFALDLLIVFKDARTLTPTGEMTIGNAVLGFNSKWQAFGDGQIGSHRCDVRIEGGSGPAKVFFNDPTSSFYKPVTEVAPGEYASTAFFKSLHFRGVI